MSNSGMARKAGRWVSIVAAVGMLAGSAGAQQWRQQNSGVAEVLNRVHFTSPLRGIAVGNAGTILATEDGGQSWTPLILTADDMLDVDFLDGSIGLIVGDNGTIFRTTDGGNSWLPVASGTGSNLAGVAFGGGGLAFAAGRDGVILRSTDAGQTWSVQETGADRYRSVSAFRSRAWVVGNGGVVRSTSDGGATWISPASPSASDLHDVVFVSENEGWVVGQNNAVFYTTDAGSTWSPREGVIGVGLNAVFFGNSQLGWTAGRLGSAFRSADGASSWTAEATPAADELNGLHFADAFHGWAVGENGRILVRETPAVRLVLDQTNLSWDAWAEATGYDLVRGDLGILRGTGGDFASSTLGCLGPGLNVTEFPLTPSPDTGQADWFVVRVNTSAGTGTYDSGSFDQTGRRDPGIGASAADCP